MTARLTSFIFIFICFIYTMCLHAQSPAAIAKINHPQGDIFGTGSVFIENVGQCGDTLAGYGYMGKIISSYEGFGNPVLFTKKGLIYVQREFKLRTRQE